MPMIDTKNLGGLKELAEMLHLPNTTVISNWYQRRLKIDRKGNVVPGSLFPDPVVIVALGSLWDKEEVKAWYRDYQPRTGSKKVGYLDDEEN